MIENRKKIQNAWAMYDWANSVYPLIISSAIFPVFYTKVTEKNLGGVVHVFGSELSNSVFYAFTIALSYLVVAMSSPILSGMADYFGNKKRFLQIFCVLGSSSTMMLVFFDTSNIMLSMMYLFFASIGFWGSLVFYNAYLPEIATVEEQDRVSAKGFSLGYLGSSILLIAVIVLFVLKGTRIFDDIRYAFVVVGIWWLFFAFLSFSKLPNSNRSEVSGKFSLGSGWKELKLVMKDIAGRTQLKRFLYSYFFYNMGVQTVMIMAVTFAAKSVIWENDAVREQSLIISILLIQFLGIAGAFIMSRFARKFGNLSIIRLTIFFWIILCICVWQFVYWPIQFFVVAGSVGLIMGGIQSMSRSTYSKMLPETKDHASYFSFYDFSEKIGLTLGTVSFAFAEAGTGNIRNSVIPILICFVLGLILSFSIPKSDVVN
jgi:UMF1 family MFS transporter